MAFHRLVAPAYFIAGGGPLPAGYDYINNAGAGTPAMADVAKVNGPNVGTYFVAFGEDGTSNHANRANKALAQNTDLIDDFLHRDLAIPKVTADVTAGAPVPSFVLVDPQGIFVGIAGTLNNANGINTFVEVLDNNDHEIIGDPATGARSRVTAIAGATVGTGFAAAAASVTFTVTPAIPTGTTYRIYYGVRGNLSVIPSDALSFVKIRAAQERDGRTIDFENQISRRSGIDVDALVASVLETPNGVRRPKSSTMVLDVDADGTVGGIRQFGFRRTRDATGVFLARAFEDPADALALTRRMELGPSGTNGYGTGGTMAFWDAQSIAGGTAISGLKYVPLSSTANGADYPRLNNKRAARSLLQLANARAYVSVGDGVTTFGDFNGATAIIDAVALFGATGTLYIRLKSGTYTLTGASGPAIPSTLTVVLEGEDRADCIVEGATTNGHTFDLTGGRLLLRSLTLRVGAGQVNGGIFTTGGQLAIDDCDVLAQKFTFTNANPVALSPVFIVPTSIARPTLFIKDSFLDMSAVVDSTGAYPLIHILVGDNLEHHNYFVQDCTLRCTDHNSPLKIEATGDAIAATRVRDVGFSRCRILLASTTIATGSYMTGNPGICWLEPRNSVNMLKVDNLVWKDCDVWANNTGVGASSVLVHIVSPSNRFNGTTEVGTTSIGRVTIDGGEWYLPDVNTTFMTWALHSHQMRVRNIRVRLTKELNGVAQQSLSVYHGTPLADYWAQVNFLQMVTADVTAAAALFSPLRSLHLENIFLRNVRQAQSPTIGGTGDLVVQCPTTGATSVRGICVHQMVSGTAASGFAPSFRISMSGPQQIGGIVDGVVWDGSGVVGAGSWASYIIYLSTGTSGSTGSHWRNCGIRHPTGGSPGYGMLLGAGKHMLTACFANACLAGLYMFPGAAPCDIIVNGGEFSNNTSVGVFFGGLSLWHFSVAFNNVRMHENGGIGFYVTAPEDGWAPGALASRGSVLHVVGCMIYSNNGVSDIQTLVELSTGSTLWPNGTYIGNTLNHLAANLGAGEAQFIRSGGSVGSGLANMRGATSGFAGSTANGLMHDNFAILRNGV
jgi:hypothetical protein